MQPDNVIMGDVAQSTALPESPDRAKEEALQELKKKAKYSRSKEFQELRENMEARIQYYQSYLPGGTPIHAVTDEERGKYWAVANIVVAELQQVINMYEGAQEILKENG